MKKAQPERAGRIIPAREQVYRDIRFLFCGSQACPPLHSWGPGVRPNFILHCILSGKGAFSHAYGQEELKKGDGFVIWPEERVFYRADVKEPWQYVWIGFEGEGAKALLQELHLGAERPVFHCDQVEVFAQLVEEMLSCRENALTSTLLLESLLYRFFYELSHRLQGEGEERLLRETPSGHVRDAIAYIRCNYHRGVTVEEVADYVGVNRSYLYTLFLKELKETPSQYISSFRLTRAAELLGIGRYSIEDVSLSCGYSDPQVFVRAFRQRFGLTPRQFRNREAEEQKRIRERLLIRPDGM